MTLSAVANNTLLSFNRGNIDSGVLFRNDDQFSNFISLASVFQSGLNFNGSLFNGLYVNTNGNVTFEGGLSQFTPNIIGNGSQTIIAPFWGDVDTRGLPQGNVYWDFDPVRDSFIVTWDHVGYFSNQVDKLNTFQLELHDQGLGNFEIIYRYTDINWTTGSASGGVNGLGGTVARFGFSSGNGLSVDLPQSGDQNQILNLENILGNTGVAGVWQFEVQSGGLHIVFGPENNTFFGGLLGDFCFGGDGDDQEFGNAGNDDLNGGNGNDGLYGGLGSDDLDGGAGADRCEGGLGRDFMTGGAGHDVFIFIAVNETGRAKSTRDQILDFRHGIDDVNVRDIDANSSRFGNQNFKFIGQDDFHHVKGELRYEKFDNPGRKHDFTVISGDINGDGRADFQIELKGLLNLTKGDFVL